VWRFATDGGHLAEMGATALGFGPGDDRLVHTVEERISLGSARRKCGRLPGAQFDLMGAFPSRPG